MLHSTIWTSHPENHAWIMAPSYMLRECALACKTGGSCANRAFDFVLAVEFAILYDIVTLVLDE